MIKNCLILLNYNDYETTIKMIKSVVEYNVVEKIIVVDNCSTDNSLNRLSDYSNSKVVLIKTSENKGYASGNNYGIKFAIDNYRAENIIVSNPDVYVEESTIINSIDYINENKDKKIAIVAPTMKELVGNDYKISSISGWKKPTYIYCVMNSLFIASKFANKLIHYKKISDAKEKEVFAVQGSFFVISANAIKECGYMDEDTFLYFEESILGEKLASKGYKNIILTDIFYNHDHSVSINKNIKNKINKYKILNQSQSVYISKYLKVGRVKRTIYKFASKVGIIERHIVYSIIACLKK